jgi:lipopolysaccharide transport protein LptA
MQAACTPSAATSSPPAKASPARADGADIVLTGVALDRLVDGKVAASGTAAEVSYVRASGRFEARDLRARMRAAGRGELSVEAPSATGAADPRQGPLELRGGVRGVAMPESAAVLLASGPGAKAGSTGAAKGPAKGAAKGSAAGKSTAALSGPEPIRYAADVFRTDPKERLVHLDGRVKLTRGDLLVTGDRSVAELAPDGAAKAAGQGLGLFKRFTVDGAVHVERGGRTADGEHAVYDSEAQTLTLSGPAPAQPGAAPLPGPILRDGQERLTGESVVLLLDRDEVRVDKPRLVLHRSQLAGEKKPAGDGSGPVEPVEIAAQALQIDQERRVLRFSGDVLLRRGELTVRGPKLDARYAEGSGEQTEIEKAEVSGGVVLRQGARRATGRTASYSATSGKVVLLGDPRLYDRGDELRGDRIELSVNTEEVRVEKARGRLHPSSHQGEAPQAAQRPAEAKP